MMDGSWEGRRTVALVLAGGISLGAYEAGAYAALSECADVLPTWVAGSSIGAVTGAIIAGNPPERRVARLREFWEAMAADPLPATPYWPGYGAWDTVRQLQSGMSATRSILFGRPGLFRLRLAPGQKAGAADVPALFDLAPLRARLPNLVDFDLLNEGGIRFSVCCTDVVKGERVVFDTGRGDRIGIDHVLASCGLLPVFAPVEVEGRLLADGALSANTPLDQVLDENPGGTLLCFVVELFARQGQRPHSLAASANRAGDLAFGQQTQRLLEAKQHEYRLRGMIERLGERLPAGVADEPEVAEMLAEGRRSPARIAMIAYRGALDEAGLLKGFDFSRATLTERWGKGKAAMQDAIEASRTPAAQARLDVIEV